MRLIVLLLITATLAGCASDETAPPTGGEFEPYKPLAGKGLIRGVVVDVSITPIAGVSVALVGSETTTLTDAEGRFEFLNVAPGAHFLRVQKAGYQAVQANAQVVADEPNPPVLRIRLALDPTFIQMAETVKWDGIMNCQVGWNAGTGIRPGVDNNAANPCFAANVAVEDMDRIVKEYHYDATPTYSQSELIWTPSQTLAGYMSVMYTYTAEGGLDNYARASGGSTLAIGANQTLLAEKEVGRGEPLIVRVFASSADTLTIIAQQDFEVFTTTFIGFEPDEGWLYTVDGQHPPPA